MQPDSLKLFQEGDEAFFCALISSMEPMLRRLIRRYVGTDEDTADDLFQDSCIKIHDRRRSYRGDGGLRAWCAQLCSRVCLDHIRHAATANDRMRNDYGSDDAPADSRSDAERATAAETFQARMEAVTDVLVALSPRRREIAIAHWYFGWDAAQIAATFHLGIPTVWTTLSQIRKELRQDLAPYVRAPSLTPI